MERRARCLSTGVLFAVAHEASRPLARAGESVHPAPYRPTGSRLDEPVRGTRPVWVGCPAITAGLARNWGMSSTGLDSDGSP